MKHNPRYNDLIKALVKHKGELVAPWQGDCWRFQAVTHPTGKEILSGQGSYMNGGRWNAPKTIKTVYGSSSEEVALKEAKAHDAYYGLPTRSPRIFVCVSLKLERVIDLTKLQNLRKLGLILKHLTQEDWRKIQDHGAESLTQAVGRAACDLGAEALLTRSAAVKGGVNVAYFPVNKMKSSCVFIYGQMALNAMSRNTSSGWTLDGLT